jgi:hypothetical protein
MKLLLRILVWSVLGLLSPFAAALAQDSGRPIPTVVSHAEPAYPPLARQARISGDVHVTFSTDGHSVVHVEADAGPELLRRAAEQNVLTWDFDSHEPGTFAVTFRYKLRDAADLVFLPPSALVQITESLPVISLDNYAWLDLGSWRAQVRSTRGSFNATLSVNYSGPNDCSVEGQVSDAPIASGCFIDDLEMLSFRAPVLYPKGERLDTLFVGKIQKDRITGTFVDDEGLTGTWTATREKQK